MPNSKQIVDAMMANGAFSQWLGIEVVDTSPGSATLQMTLRDDMTNGFGVAHGGISYSLADSALAFASNGHGQHAISVETSISHAKPIRVGDLLVATAAERQRGKSLARYDV
ncbi:MAG: hotdog fold thioesterase, partial [Flavobacteriales bacterium]|nr:hotdog fold thioesterase [Flavobacteriales bacterium]MBT4528587.1 hotdog fold thioesterase [Flavobacteriales bacterium]MBT5025038.1 hotdog fold thioesterase [Flavobacteriales bacterium]MBT5340582.1 hotdog fold thioesterase [Flavobacteriales bacterium]MBT5422228.1 hotdog fold thioesterase [Flavobacteriales bacterium]